MDMLGKRRYESASCELRYTQALPYELRQTVREVFNVQTDKGMRGKGHGSKLMQEIAKEADQAQKILLLIPATDLLQKWYNIVGFEVIQSEPVVLMMRKPSEIETRGTNGRSRTRSD
jgi:N-acetylglutamate synthase-like GNAT family acetyltransferase